LPGRCIAGKWRFAHSAVLLWLSAGEPHGAETQATGADDG
jgi:hypothetical protein